MERFGVLTGHVPCGSRQPRRYRAWLERRVKRVALIQTTPTLSEPMVSRAFRAIQTKPGTPTTREPFPAKCRQEPASGVRGLGINREPTASQDVVGSVGKVWRGTADREDSQDPGEQASTSPAATNSGDNSEDSPAPEAASRWDSVSWAPAVKLPVSSAIC